MKALADLFSTAYGLISVAVIVFMLGMGRGSFCFSFGT
jgi:hypothetical protein